MLNIKLRNKDMGCLGVILIGVLFAVLGLALPALIIMLAWNELLIEAFKELRAITFWEALLISLVFGLISGRFRRG